MLKNNFTLPETFIKDTFAVRLFKFLSSFINDHYFPLENNRLNDEFYEYCREALIDSGIADEIDDTDLIIIYLKQLMIIMRHGNFLQNFKGIARIKRDILSNNTMFLTLFYSFWNNVQWEDIFPSLPNAARELKRNRQVMIDLMVNQAGMFRIDRVTNDFFINDTFSGKRDIYLISFLDFYFFTWLKFFGITRYLLDLPDEPVQVELTEYGRIFLKHIQQGHIKDSPTSSCPFFSMHI